MTAKDLPIEEDFRTPSNVMLPDDRSNLVGLNSIEQLHEAIDEYRLDKSIPENIRIQFATVKNLILYSYYVYRFFPVAKHQLFVVLEHAIKACIGEQVLQDYKKAKNRKQGKNSHRFSMGLKLSLHYLVEHDLIKNEDFRVWQEGKAREAWARYRIQVSKKMDEENLQCYELDENEVDYDGFNYEHDYVSVLANILPKVRNSLAHGSNYLSASTVHDLEVVTTIINKIFARASWNMQSHRV